MSDIIGGDTVGRDKAGGNIYNLNGFVERIFSELGNIRESLGAALEWQRHYTAQQEKLAADVEEIKRRVEDHDHDIKTIKARVSAYDRSRL